MKRWYVCMILLATVGLIGARASQAGVGGGFTHAGLQGEYFRDSSGQHWTGQPVFTRSDVRINFAWQPVQDAYPNVIGSNSYDLPAQHFSVRWTGQVIARFSQSYTFTVAAHDGVQLKIKPADGSAWTTLADHESPTGTATTSGSYKMMAGKPYALELDYYQSSGPAVLRLAWSSRDTPEEIIGPLAHSGIMNPEWNAAYTDIVKGARNSWLSLVPNAPAPAMDAQGWPKSDGGYVFQESLNRGLDADPLMLGKITYSFHGKADVSLKGNVKSGSLTFHYDPQSNTSSGSFEVINNHSNASSFDFRNATRNGQPGGPGGITDLRLMRPVAPETQTSYDPHILFTPQIKAAMSHFTHIRYQLIANQQVDWSDRTLPNYFNQNRGNTTKSHFGIGFSPEPNGASWEYEIMLANETGRDVMFSLPPVASDQYITNLANLLKYGSDAQGMPYTKPTAHPAYPALNPNLHVYLELGNELWNWAAPFWIDSKNINHLVEEHAVANDADFQILNFDHLPLTKNAKGDYSSINTWRYRMIVLRMIQISDLFRAVYGDAAMPNSGNLNAVIRPVYEWQYENINGTAKLGLSWTDQYFNNADGVQHVATPHPLNYWLWGGGGATYYGASNSEGLTDLPADHDFSATSLPPGYNQAPSGAAFTFTGSAGIAGYTDGNTVGIPKPLTGQQLGYLTDKGTLQLRFTAPAKQISDVYAVAFKAVNRTAPDHKTVDQENVRVYLDYGTPNQVDLTARSFSQWKGYTPLSYAQAAKKTWNGQRLWLARVVAWVLSDYYDTKSFHAAPGSAHTITFVGQGDLKNPAAKPTVFFTDVRLTSVDAIFAGDIPAGGQANGQPTGLQIKHLMKVETDWANAFGLKELCYEGGWSLGGDNGGSWIQLAAKYGDPRTADVQQRFMDDFHRAGGTANMFGTYAQWPSWADSYAQQGLLDVTKYPLIQGIDRVADTLPPAITNAAPVPGRLDAGNITLCDQDPYRDPATMKVLWGHPYADPKGHINHPGGWISWNIVAATRGEYRFVCSTSGTGHYRLLIDEKPVLEGTVPGDSAGALELAPGLHAVKIYSTGATPFQITGVTVTAGSPPLAAPPHPSSSTP